jgi:hypothetical protein
VAEHFIRRMSARSPAIGGRAANSPRKRSVQPQPAATASVERAGRTRGRPPKFGKRARPVTISLPEDLLESLRAQNLDLGRAIVELFDRRAEGGSDSPVQLADFGRGALILVPPASALRRLPGIELIPLTGGRALIALDQPMSASDLELALSDGLAAGDCSPGDEAVLADVVGLLRDARRSSAATLRQRTIVIIERTLAVRRRRSR